MHSTCWWPPPTIGRIPWLKPWLSQTLDSPQACESQNSYPWLLLHFLQAWGTHLHKHITNIYYIRFQFISNDWLRVQALISLGNRPAPLPTHSCFMVGSSSKATRTSVSVSPSFRKLTVNPKRISSRLNADTYANNLATLFNSAHALCTCNLYSGYETLSHLARTSHIRQSPFLHFD